MSDIKNVLSLLCQHLNLSISVPVKPEHFRLAKFNDSDQNVTEILWAVLEILSSCAVKKKQIDFDFQEYNTLTATKLCFAYLQYPVVEFYALTKDNNCNRQLLIAFAWLLGTQKVLSTVIHSNVANSVLGTECSHIKMCEQKEVQNSPPKSLIGQINNVIHLNGKVNYNIKQISELLSERAKLITAAHAASINVSALPHLSVSELALTKKLATTSKSTRPNETQNQLKELSTIGSLLDTHMKWMKKEHVFFDWMVTVIQEHHKSLTANISQADWQEVSKFISLLRHIIKKKLEHLPSKPETSNPQDLKLECVSRLLRTEGGDTEAEEWLTNANVQLAQETEELSRKKEELSKELKEILKSIPSCIQL